MLNFQTLTKRVSLVSGLLLAHLMLACGTDSPPQMPLATPLASEKNDNLPEHDQDENDKIGNDPIVGPEIDPVSEQEPRLPEFAPEVQKAIQAALYGPEWKGAAVFGHTWNIKPLSLSSVNGRTFVSGRISHHLPFAPDNQIDYLFSFANGEVLEMNIQIQEGGWLPFAKPILKIVEQFSGIVLPVEFLSEIYRQLSDNINGDWRDQSQRLAAILAIEAYRQSEE